MALEDHGPSGSLPCGTLLDDLIAQVADGVAPLDRAHQAACRYCQNTLQAIQDAWEEFQQFARAAVAVPEDVAERVMTRVRALSRADAGTVLISDAYGQTRIADSVVSQLARRAALAVDHVRWVSVQPVGESAQPPGGVQLDLRLVASYGHDLQSIADEVRHRVFDALRSQTGATVTRIDVAVEDVVVDDDD